MCLICNCDSQSKSRKAFKSILHQSISTVFKIYFSQDSFFRQHKLSSKQPFSNEFKCSWSFEETFFFWWEIWYVMNNIPKRAKLNKYIRRSLGWTEHTSWILFYLLVKKLYIVENRTKVGFNSNGTGFSICSFPLVYLCFSKFFILMDFLVNQRISRELDAYLFPVHPSHL